MIDNVTPHILIKNDEYWLPYCLESISGQFKTYIMYDVGSTDKTTAIASWWANKEMNSNNAKVLFRNLPDCSPEVQICFRNSMIAETKTPLYMIVDGDEVYHEKEFNNLRECADQLVKDHERDNRIKYGMFRRLEFNYEIDKKYDIERSHHRLYTTDAFWEGTHPGEAPHYVQNGYSEKSFLDKVRVFHFHNTNRSSANDKATWSRAVRKTKPTYHPGELKEYALLKELPLLRNPIGDWPVCPELKSLQAQFNSLII